MKSTDLNLNPNNKTTYQPPFYASQNSNDIYNVLTPGNKNHFCLVVNEKDKQKPDELFLRIELFKDIILTGIELDIQSFPFDWFTIEIDGKKMNINDNEKKEKIIKINQIKCNEITLKPYSKNFKFTEKKVEYYPSLNHIELFT